MNLSVTFENKKRFFKISSLSDIPRLIYNNYGINTIDSKFEFKITTIMDETSVLIFSRDSIGDLELFMGDFEYESVASTKLKLIKPTI